MKEEFKGMTVNEMLYVSGLMSEFDAAVKNKKKDLIIKILKKLELEDKSINDVLESINL